MDRETLQMTRTGLLALVAGVVGWLITRNPFLSLAAWLGGAIVWLSYCMYMGNTMEMKGLRNARPIWGIIGLLGELGIAVGFYFLWLKRA